MHRGDDNPHLLDDLRQALRRVQRGPDRSHLTLVQSDQRVVGASVDRPIESDTLKDAKDPASKTG